MLNLRRLKQVLWYDPATGLFRWRKPTSTRMHVGDTAGNTNKLGYLVICIDYHKYLGHRLAWFYTKGRWPKAEIDHRRGKSNRFTNLREANSSQNKHNSKRRVDNTSGVRGISWFERTKRWRAYINLKGRQVHLGYFTSFRAAKLARIRAARKYHGKFMGAT